MSNQDQNSQIGLIDVNLGAPATLENVLTAVSRLAEYSEADIHRIASEEDGLSKIFPYEASESDLPPPALARWSDVVAQRDSQDEVEQSEAPMLSDPEFAGKTESIIDHTVTKAEEDVLLITTGDSSDLLDEKNDIAQLITFMKDSVDSGHAVQYVVRNSKLHIEVELDSQNLELIPKTALKRS